jgi:hypothetical protein
VKRIGAGADRSLREGEGAVSKPAERPPCPNERPISCRPWHDAILMKITDPRVMKTVEIATAVACGLLLGYISGGTNHSTSDWLLLASMTVILVCSLFVMLNDIWKPNA